MKEKVKALLIGGLVTLRALKSLIPSSHKKKEAESHEAGAEGKADQPEGEERPAAPVVPSRPNKDRPAAKKGAAKGKDKAQRGQNRWPTDERWMTVFTGLMFFVTLVNAAVAVLQVISVNRIFNIVERPYVAIKEMKITGVSPGQTPTATILIENSGRTPAINVQVFSYAELLREPLPENPKYRPLPPQSKAFMQAGSVRQQTVSMSGTIDDNTMRMIVNGILRLYVYGFADYKDGTGNLHTYKFCGIYNPQMGDLEVCSQHNGSD